MLSIVKLGGSFVASTALPDWLRAVERAAGRVVLVPGGGPFADAVRVAQQVMGFDDVAAHEMALLAMTQYGRALVSLGRGLVMAESAAAIRAAVAAARVPVWSPVASALRGAGVAESWSVTSDSLALVLARELGAARVVLVKQRAATPDADPALLAQEGLVDQAFPAQCAAFAGELRIVGPRDFSVLA